MAIRIPVTGKFHPVTDDYSSASRALVFMEDLLMNLGPDFEKWLASRGRPWLRSE